MSSSHSVGQVEDDVSSMPYHIVDRDGKAAAQRAYPSLTSVLGSCHFDSPNLKLKSVGT